MAIGSTLARARAELGLSVPQVAERTKIRGTLIEAIEAERFDSVDAPVFVRAHIKNIALALGIDPAPLLAEFDGKPLLERLVSEPTEELDILEMRKSAAKPRRNFSPVIAGAGAVALGVLMLIFIWLGQNDAGNSPMPNASQSQPTSMTPTDSATDSNAVTLKVWARQESWLMVTAAGGEVLFEGTVLAGKSLTFSDASEISIRVGDAGAIKLKVNGVELDSLGAPGEVVDLVFGPGDPTVAG